MGVAALCYQQLQGRQMRLDENGGEETTRFLQRKLFFQPQIERVHVREFTMASRLGSCKSKGAAADGDRDRMC